MALTGSFTYKGITLPNSYIRATNFVFIGQFTCKAQLEVYVDQQQAFTVPYNPFAIITCDFIYDPNGPSLNSQAYSAALLLSEFLTFQSA